MALPRFIVSLVEALIVVVSSVAVACLLVPACALRPPGGYPRIPQRPQTNPGPTQMPYSRLIARSARRLHSALVPTELQPV
jgi:hypothetical protein